MEEEEDYIPIEDERVDAKLEDVCIDLHWKDRQL